MTAPHAVLKKFPPLGKPKSPDLAAVEIRDLSKHFGPATTVRAQDPVGLTGALERRGHRVDRDGDGLEATRRITEDGELHSRVVILTTFERDEYVFEALRSGASGFLLKNAPPEELLHAVHVVTAGEALLAPSVTRRIIEQFARRPVRPELGTRLDALTQREREVLTMLACGKSNAELAAELFVTEGTIKTHVSSLLAKLGLRDRVQAVVLAYESGLVTPGA